jgi:hypothetical protein
MSDVPQGPGWWQASDGRWYPPQAPPGGQPIGAALDIGTAMSWAWTAFRADPGTFVLLALAPIGVGLVASVLMFVAFIPALFGDLGIVVGVLGFTGVVVATMVVSFVVSRAMYAAALGMCDGRRPSPSLLVDFTGLGSFVAVTLLYALVVGIGMLACVLPGLVAAVAFIWAPWAVIDQRLDAIEAMRRSWEVTRDRLGEILVFLLVLYLVGLAATALCFVLAVAVMPMQYLAMAWAWRRMQGQPISR